jgi:hypothetical protein
VADDDGRDGAWAGSYPGRSAPDVDRSTGWPPSAICAVAILGAVTALLLFINLVGIRIGASSYDAEAGGSMAEWFEAIATLVAVPVAVLVGVRQLRTTSEGLELGRRRFVAEEIERAERQRAEQALLRDAVRLRVDVANIVDLIDLATDAERTAVDQWRTEYRYRGWELDPSASTWSQGSVRRSNAEQLAAEPSPLVPKPWFVAVECTNTGPVGVTLLHWAVQVDHTSTVIDSRAELRPGESVRRRLGVEAGLAPAYSKPADVESGARRVTVSVDGRDAADRPFRIVARRE